MTPWWSTRLVRPKAQPAKRPSSAVEASLRPQSQGVDELVESGSRALREFVGGHRIFLANGAFRESFTRAGFEVPPEDAAAAAAADSVTARGGVYLASPL
jgi:hypothetical protein